MAKILVADDNSNVQKTVTLALANLGIDVLAVNNGESAVRKLADFAPDLVLADIFMPVRNGYEVCEYVKKDSRFAHVPVVLLVGAFDPFDEREAQRVGADGILKKPFVPPDPLITMVKTLLDRSMGERLVEASVSKATAAARARSDEGGTAELQPAVAVASEEAPVLEFPRPQERIAFGEGEHPVAFSQLLEAPSQVTPAQATGLIEPVDDEQILTSSRDANLGDPVFWRNDESESEIPPVAEESEDDLPASLGARTWNQDVPLSRVDDAASLQPIAHPDSLEQMKPSDPLELILEGQDETSPTIVESGSIFLDTASQDQLTVDANKAKELAANPLEWMATAPSIPLLDISPEESAEHSPELSLELSPELSLEQSEDESAANPGSDESVPGAINTIDTTITIKAEPPVPQQIPPAVSVPEPSPVLAVAPEQASAGMTSDTTSDIASEGTLEVAPEVASEIASSEVASNVASNVAADVVALEAASKISPVVASTLPASSPLDAKHADATPEPNKTQPSIPLIAQRTEDTVRAVPKQDWVDLTASIRSRANELVPQKVSAIPERSQPISAVPSGNSQPEGGKLGAFSSPDPALVEAVVQRVLEKMRPQVVDIITKEFLRPIVQALVTREIDKH